MLQGTEKLFLEHPRLWNDPSYFRILREDSWGRFAISRNRHNSTSEAKLQFGMLGRQRCESSIKAFSTLEAQVLRAGHGQAIFPQLKSISIGSIFGTARSFWIKNFPSVFPRYSVDYMQDVSLACHRLLEIPSLRHWCEKSCSGPLSCTPLISIPVLVPRLTFTSHFRVDDLFVPVVFGARHRWVCDDFPRDQSVATVFQDEERSYMDALEHLGNCSNRYRQPANSSHASRYTTTEHVEVFCGSFAPYRWHESMYRDVRTLMDDMGRACEGALAVHIPGCRDTLRYKPICDAPTCEACGWVPAEWERGVKTEKDI